ncbi:MULTISPECIES: hypothetical protein [Pectobacterium]|uniref:hypothetical protein n=1 Tax=Pectobacterium TaxID=122277 RepID=UPI000C7E89AF|nr:MULTISPECIES: hypothetical protein [Pectobacterium]MCL6393222.1 hypothetical protein [Pectobacterium atrosepticum]PLY35728.1 hypothetical protein F164LOC_18655 [Pectobacterium carotovorum]MCH5052550.1 hypothetical protein [Pectobacterium aquaticum]RRO03351.1 hypothetical protein DMB81_019090 [Pectobacterium aquaticum]UEM40641.1 hypothetical protein DMB82_0006575 [Pectobacterium aquaticum]
MKKKKSKKNPLQDTAVLSRIAQRASQNAIKEAFTAGIAIHYILEGKLIKAYPDGRKECVKELGMNPILLRELLE